MAPYQALKVTLYCMEQAWIDPTDECNYMTWKVAVRDQSDIEYINGFNLIRNTYRK